MKKKSSIYKYWYDYIVIGVFFLLTAISVLSAITESVILLAFVIAGMFLFVASPVCSFLENIWMFALIAIVGLPVNIKIILSLLSYFPLIPTDNGFIILLINLLRGLSIFTFIFPAEQIVFGLIVRKMWPTQVKLFQSENTNGGTL